MKKIFAIIMVACLLTGALSVTAFAADEQERGVVMTVSALKKGGKVVKIEDKTSFEDGWNFAMAKANDKDYLDNNEYERIVVDLHSDWKANEEGEFGDSGGEGFQWSTIYIPEQAIVTLNMNGHTIDRGLGDNNELDGEVICIEQKADVIINGGKSGDTITRADDMNATVQFGTITGGNSDNGAGGIHIQDKANVTLNNVKIVGNVADDDDGGGIAMYDKATLVMNGGGFINNKNYSLTESYGAAIYIKGCTAKFNKVLFSNNQFTYTSGSGAVLYSDTRSVVEMDECKLINNGNLDKEVGVKGALSVIYMFGGKIEIKNTVFEGNGSSEEDLWGSRTLSVIELWCSKLTMDNCTFTKNKAIDYMIDTHASYPNEVLVLNSTFTNNVGGVFAGDIAEFTNCAFDKNGGSYTFGAGMYDHEKVVLNDCSIGNSTFEKEKNIEIVDTDAEDGTNLPASIFSRGSLVMIVSFVALIVSVAAIIVNVSSKKNEIQPAEGEKSGEVK